MRDNAFIKDEFRHTEEMLRSAGIDDAFTEARILLQHVLDVDGARFLLRLDDLLDAEMKRNIDEVVQRRLRRRFTFGKGPMPAKTVFSRSSSVCCRIRCVCVF